MDLNTVWTKSLDLIRQRMTYFSYKSWIETLEPVSYSDDTLVLMVPDADIKKTLTDYYYKDILDCCKQSCAGLANVDLILPEQRKSFVSVPQPENDGYSTLNPKYTFDSFIVGNSNQFPHAAALAVAQNPGLAYNPLFIYGGVGLGKTHLMHAIGHYIKQHNPQARIMYVTCETFSNELITAIQNNKTPEFRKRYREVDILMIDDVQFISRSQSGQEEFFNTFNSLYLENKAIVISSDRPPKEISKLEERLCSRFQQGLITDIQPPDLETRIAILRNRTVHDGFDVSEEVLTFIATHVVTNIRELEGCLTRVVAYSKLRHKPLTLELTSEALKDLLPEIHKQELTPQIIRETVADFYSVSIDMMDSPRRDREIVMPRQVAMYLCHTMLGLPYKRVSFLFGRNDHTTAMSACEKIEKMLETDSAFSMDLEDIKKRMQ